VGDLFRWLGNNWFSLIQSVGIIAGLFFAAVAVRRETLTRRLSNLLALKAEHRELWERIAQDPKLTRLFSEETSLQSPISPQEEIFCRQIIVHSATAFSLIKDGTPLDSEALSADIGSFFSRAVPFEAWKRAKHAQSISFIAFVEEAISRHKAVEAVSRGKPRSF
jgi:hypothetical protein